MCWDLAKTVSLAQAERTEAATIKDYANHVKWNAMIDSKSSWEKIAELPMHQWLHDADHTYAVALCTNAVITAYGMMDAAAGTN